LFSGGADQEIYTWRATTACKGVSYRGQQGHVNTQLWFFRSAAFTAGRIPTMLMSTPSPIKFPARLALVNTIASAGADGTVHLWDARILIYREHNAAVNGLTLVPDSLTLALASDDGSVHVWNVAVWYELVLTQGIGSSTRKSVENGHHGQKVNAVTALFDGPRSFP
jgi:WD40 repeat protein